MSISRQDAESVANHAAGYNFDDLLEVFTLSADPLTVRQHLQNLYYSAVEHIGRDGDVFPLMVDSLYILQLIIQATENMDKHNEKHLEIRVV